MNVLVERVNLEKIVLFFLVKNPHFVSNMVRVISKKILATAFRAGKVPNVNIKPAQWIVLDMEYVNKEFVLVRKGSKA